MFLIYILLDEAWIYFIQLSASYGEIWIYLRTLRDRTGKQQFSFLVGWLVIYLIYTLLFIQEH